MSLYVFVCTYCRRRASTKACDPSRCHSARTCRRHSRTWGTALRLMMGVSALRGKSLFCPIGKPGFAPQCGDAHWQLLIIVLCCVILYLELSLACRFKSDHGFWFWPHRSANWSTLGSQQPIPTFLELPLTFHYRYLTILFSKQRGQDSLTSLQHM